MARYVKYTLVFFAGIWAVLLGTTLGYGWNLTHAASGNPPTERAAVGSAERPAAEMPDYSEALTEVMRSEREGYWTVAVFGVDSRDGALGKGTHSDMVMICNLDLDTGEIRLVSVYRDTYLRTNREKNAYDKLNQAYFFGGPERAVEVLEDNLDLEIDDYAAFSWKAVVDAVNILGGIDVDITKEEFKVINGFITETVESTGVGSHQLKQAGSNHLDGVQAVAYARLRKMDTDFKRTERQRLVAELALSKARAADFATLSSLARTVLPQLSTSIGMKDVMTLAARMKKFHLTETAGFPFQLKDAYVGKKDCVIPTTLENNVVRLHEFLFDENGYQPSGEVQEISRQIKKKTDRQAGK